MKKLIVLIAALAVSCASTVSHISPSDGGPTRARGCAHLTGIERMKCKRAHRAICEQAHNSVLKRTRIGNPQREGRVVVTTWKYCFMGDKGYKFKCWTEARPRYKPTFWQRAGDYGLVAGAGFVLGVVARGKAVIGASAAGGPVGLAVGGAILIYELLN